MTQHPLMTRRGFLHLAAAVPLAAVGQEPGPLVAAGASRPGTQVFAPPLTVFSKVYQEVKLSYEQSADVTAAAGLDGIDCAVRPGGEVLPERVADDLPRYDDALRKRGVRMLLMTTAITGVRTPHVEDVLRTARRLEITHYRIGYWKHKPDVAPEALVKSVQDELKQLAALNRATGVCALFQNHSTGGSKSAYAGGDLAELRRILEPLDPAHIGVAFDAGHAMLTHGDAWPAHFEALKPWIKVAYVKDAKRGAGFVPFGRGEVDWSRCFGLLRAMDYRNPLSLHIEYEWSPKDRDTLVNELTACRRAVAGWLA